MRGLDSTRKFYIRIFLGMILRFAANVKRARWHQPRPFLETTFVQGGKRKRED